MESRGITLVFLERGLALDRRPYADWREVQETYEGYKASLGPWTVDELFDYFALDYAIGDEPFSRAAVEDFLRGPEPVLIGQ